MSKKKKELNVDTIGNQEDTITKNEEKLISDFIKKQKIKKVKRSKKSTVSQ